MLLQFGRFLLHKEEKDWRGPGVFPSSEVTPHFGVPRRVEGWGLRGFRVLGL